MQTDRYVDTSGWAAWTNDNDVFHDAANRIFESVWTDQSRLVTTNLVLIELTALFIRMKVGKIRQVQFFDELPLDFSIQVVTVDPKIETKAWSLWRSRLDKNWTLVDCASFVVMNQLGLTEAITNDQHFEQAGFRRLLK